MCMLSVTDAVQVCPEKEELEPWVINDMDRLLGETWLTGNEDVFQQIFHLIFNENVSGSDLLPSHFCENINQSICHS